MTTIKELQPDSYIAVTNYTRPRWGNAETEEAWKQRQADRRAAQKVLSTVAEGCTVETVRGTTLRDGEGLTASDVGGMANLERLRHVGAVNMISENQRASNAGEFELIATKSFTHGGRIYDEKEGFDSEELNMPGTDGYQTIGEGGKLIDRPGRDPVDGAEMAEALIMRNLAKRATLRKKVTAAVKKRLAAAKAAESGA